MSVTTRAGRRPDRQPRARGQARGPRKQPCQQRRSTGPEFGGSPQERHAETLAATGQLRSAYSGTFFGALCNALEETGHTGSPRLALAYSRATVRTYTGHGLDGAQAQRVRSWVAAGVAERLGVPWHAERSPDHPDRAPGGHGAENEPPSGAGASPDLLPKREIPRPQQVCRERVRRSGSRH